jgi:metal-responsive CopG/Arc/MetJ family transcriptional regulator
MATAKVAITLDIELLAATDEMVKLGYFPSRSNAIAKALKKEIEIQKQQRLSIEAAKLRKEVEELPWLEEETEAWLKEY